MNNGGEAADQMVREALQVTEVAIKLSALGIKNALALSLAYAKENPKVKGKTSLDRLLREGKELKIIALQSKDVGQFKELAKQYGVLFAVIKDKAQNEKVDVMFKAEDVAKLNRIYPATSGKWTPSAMPGIAAQIFPHRREHPSWLPTAARCWSAAGTTATAIRCCWITALDFPRGTPI